MIDPGPQDGPDAPPAIHIRESPFVRSTPPQVPPHNPRLPRTASDSPVTASATACQSRDSHTGTLTTQTRSLHCGQIRDSRSIPIIHKDNLNNRLFIDSFLRYKDASSAHRGSVSPNAPSASRKPLLSALAGERQAVPPVWLMRQAGRYLPEYRAVRERAGSFLGLCMSPELAAEVTLQPVRRFDLDAAILFSDILLVPYALGQELWFEEGSGPRLDALEGSAAVARLSTDRLLERLGPAYEALCRVRAMLPAETALLGFAGAPWTLASYMLEGGSSRDFAVVKAWAYGAAEVFASLIDVLVEATILHLRAQVEAGAEALQVFDSWAGVLPARELQRWCLEPTRRIVEGVKAACPQVPVIVFPRGAGLLYGAYAMEAGADALGLDATVPLDWAHEHLQTRLPLQGNLDPAYLLVGGGAMSAATREILATLAQGAFVFNLGHGVLPQTPPEHVSELVAIVRGESVGGRQ